MYGSQHPSQYAGGYQNPPQPEWQSQQPAQSTYNPSTYGPINPYSQTSAPSASVSPTPNPDTSSWGVRHNQHTAQGPPPPPLPPRNPDLYSPPSPPPPPPPPRPASSSNPTPPNATSWNYNTAAYTQPVQSAQGAPLPPPRPPVPAAYQNEIQQNAQQWQQTQQTYAPQYSQHPPTHHYDPSAQPSPQPQGSSIYTPVTYDQGETNYQQTPAPSAPYAPPVGSPPPIFPMSSPPPAPPSTTPSAGTQWVPQSSNFTSGASILGQGGVSDWEHLTPTPGNVDDYELHQKKPAPGNPMAQINTSPPPQKSIYNHPQNYNPASSPVSSPNSPIQTAPQSAYPPRADSTHSQISLMSQEDRSDTIDGVIQAWSQQPVSPITKPQTEAYPTSPDQTKADLSSPASVAAKPAFPQSVPAQPHPLQKHAASGSRVASPMEANPASNVGEQTAQTEQTTGKVSTPSTNETAPAQIKALDPYDDLDPWSKSSLFRYVTMLRKEAVADSEEEKYKIFTGFVAKETRLREVLYNIETADKETKPVSNAVPDAKMPNESLEATANQLKKYLEEMKGVSVPPLPDGPIPVESEFPRPLATRSDSADSADSDGVMYSPGGRPILSKGQPAQSSVKKQDELRRSASNPQGRNNNASPSKFANQSRANMMIGQDERTVRSISVPPVSMNSSTMVAPQHLTPLVSEPPQPAYTPFRYAEGPQRGAEILSIAQPGYQAYSALRQASAESGRAMSAAPMLQTPNQDESVKKSTGSIQPDETFLGIIREKSVSYRGKNEHLGSDSGFEELGALIPDPFPTLEESVEISNVRKKMDVFSEDFRYIYITRETWELAARDRREKLEKERLARQEASEAHIDSLFNEKEIGYADINPLEEEFRQGEARTQLAEERKELDSFIRRVYNPVDTRLKEEIVELKALHQRALDELSHDKIHANNNSKYQISRTMKTINTLSSKLEARYQKRLDLGIEREHYRKKAERRPLVFLGDSRALKKLDADFEKMEKQNIVEAAKDRDERANKLTDIFDEAILYALGNHQRVLDDTAAKTRKLDVGMVERSNLSEADRELLLRSIAALTKLLAEDAESMLTSFKEADTLLNEADYNVSVAEAQYANADPEVFRRLEDEKKKEDDKIQEDHTSKVASVKKAPAEICSKIDEILTAMHKAPGPGPGPWRRPTAHTSGPSAGLQTPPQPRSRSHSPTTVLPTIVDDHHPAEALMPGPGPPRLSSAETEQQERLRKALEDAKRRNAAKNYTT